MYAGINLVELLCFSAWFYDWTVKGLVWNTGTEQSVKKTTFISSLYVSVCVTSVKCRPELLKFYPNPHPWLHDTWEPTPPFKAVVGSVFGAPSRCRFKRGKYNNSRVIKNQACPQLPPSVNESTPKSNLLPVKLWGFTHTHTASWDEKEGTYQVKTCCWCSKHCRQVPLDITK